MDCNFFFLIFVVIVLRSYKNSSIAIVVIIGCVAILDRVSQVFEETKSRILVVGFCERMYTVNYSRRYRKRGKFSALDAVSGA